MPITKENISEKLKTQERGTCPFGGLSDCFKGSGLDLASEHNYRAPKLRNEIMAPSLPVKTSIQTQASRSYGLPDPGQEALGRGETWATIVARPKEAPGPSFLRSTLEKDVTSL